MASQKPLTSYVSKAFEITHNDVGVNDRNAVQALHLRRGRSGRHQAPHTLKKSEEKAPDETHDLHKEALGNVDIISDSHGAMSQTISCDPLGK